MMIKKIKAPIGDENFRLLAFKLISNPIKKIKAPIGDENTCNSWLHILLFYSIKKIKAPIGDENTNSHNSLYRLFLLRK